jgi:uncharacterized membrane protein
VAAGGAAAGKMDMGFDDDILRQFSQDLKPNSSPSSPWSGMNG